jgi:TRAP-type uncharacterized transport system fused permease subunit
MGTDHHADTPAPEDHKVQEMLASETGARHPAGFPRTLLWAVPLLWSLFQLWYA